MIRFLCLFALVLSCQPVFSQITSTFDTDADEWTFLDSSTPITVNHQSSNGNPGGFVSVTYSASTTTTVESWFAPAKFLGNLVVRSLGRDFKFDLQQSISGIGSSAGIAEIRIERGGDVLIYQLPVKPEVAPAWTSYSVKLDETSGWLWSSTSGSAATRSQIIYILTNVTAIEIRGTYGTNASYTSGLDNVIIEQNALQTAPQISSLSITTGKPGDEITINGSGFDSDPTNNAVYFGGVSAQLTSASTTQLTVIVPQGASYSKITIVNKINGLSSTSPNQFTPTFIGGGRIIPASFKPKVDFLLDATSGNELNGIRVADLDDDGWNDIIVTERLPASVSIFRNLGVGGSISTTTFSSKIILNGAGGSGGLLIVDLDGDGKQDVVATNGSAFITFRNTSTPDNITFETAEAWPMANSGFLSNVADIDGDGRADLIGQHGNGSVAVDFWIAQNISSPGNIEFGSSVSYFGGSTLDAGDGVQVGDLNNDGKPDLLVEHNFGGLFSIIKNNSIPGTILLETPVQFNEPIGGGIQITDVNLDGKNDLIWKRGSNNDDVRIRLNTHVSGSFTLADFATQIIFDSELLNYGGVTLGDFNGDGKPDIMASDSRQFGIFENIFSNGPFDSNSFASAFIIEASGTSTYPTSPLAADLNGDDRPEIILGITNTNPVRFLIYENKNVQGPVISLNTVSPLAAPVGATVTITGSNFSEVPTENDVFFGAVQASVLTASATELTVSVPPGTTYAPVSARKGELMSRYHLPFQTTFSVGISFDNTHFAPPVEYTLSGANYDIEVMDLDRDGKPDIAAEGGSSLTYFFHNTHSTGTITTSSLTAAGVTNTSAANGRLVDADGDGLADLVSPNGRAYQNLSTPGSISFSTDVSLGLGDSNIDFGDLNLDGKQDLVIAAGGSSTMRIMENRSKVGPFVAVGVFGTFAPNVTIAKPSTGGGIVMTDLDNDGFPDVAVTNPGSDNLSIFHNAGRFRANVASFNPRIDIVVGDNPGRIYTGDFDLDGRNDLILYHGTGTTSTLLTILHNQSTVGNISFNRIDLTNPSATTVVAIADLDGDGKPEIITVSETGNRFSIFKNIHTPGALSTASFDAPFNTTVTAPRGVATGDLNLDGKPEIILTRAAGLLVVYENLVPTSILTVTTQPVSPTYACEGTATSFIVAASGTTNIAYQWQHYNSGTGLFEDIADNATYSGTATATLTINNVSSAEAGDYQCVISGDAAADVITDVANLVFNSLPSPPDVVNGVSCGSGTVTLTASGGSPGDYRWYTDSPLTPIPGEQNETYTTPSLTANTTYYVSIVDTFCESVTVPVTVLISSPPDQPTVSSSITPIGDALTICSTTLLTLSAPNGFASYLWSNGSVTQQISVTGSGNYSVTVTNADGCASPASSDLTITVQDAPCSNAAPVITNTTITTTIGNSVSLDLQTLISDADNNLVLSSLIILQQPASGAPASLNGTMMEINYSGISFTGQDAFTIQVCDVFGECTSQQLQITVIGEIEIFNALSPNNDGQNDAFIIRYIDLIPDTQNNRVTIYNRWGDVVFEITDYNNTDRVFRGQNDNGKDLPSGTYFYTIEFGSRMEMKTGYLSVRR